MVTCIELIGGEHLSIRLIVTLIFVPIYIDYQIIKKQKQKLVVCWKFLFKCNCLSEVRIHQTRMLIKWTGCQSVYTLFWSFLVIFVIVFFLAFYLCNRWLLSYTANFLKSHGYLCSNLLFPWWVISGLLQPPEYMPENLTTYSAWVGGAILAKVVFPQNQHVTKADYDETGPSIVHRKCFWKHSSALCLKISDFFQPTCTITCIS